MPSKKVKSLPKTYELALQELQGLIVQIENGSMPLDELLLGYERSAQLLQFCRESLQVVEDQVKVIEQQLNVTEGQPAAVAAANYQPAASPSENLDEIRSADYDIEIPF